MTYRYKVTLKGIKGFYRIYNLNGSNSLYSFHKQMRSDLEFPQDQLILFKAFDKDGAVAARYGLFDLGSGTVDDTTVADTVKKGVTSFEYFYDTTNKKSVIVTLEGPVEDGTDVRIPTLVEAKGPAPIEFENGYVAFEDLPDEQRHLPSESDKAKKSKLDSLLDALAGEAGDDAGGDDDDEDADSEDAEDIDEEDGEDDEKDDDEDGSEIYDGSEELTL